MVTIVRAGNASPGGEAMQFDPTQTIVGVQWAASGIIGVFRFIGTGGATEVDAHVPVGFGRFTTNPGDEKYMDMIGVTPTQDAKAFFRTHKPDGSTPGNTNNGGVRAFNVAKYRTGETYWYFALFAQKGEFQGLTVDMTSCFGSGVGSVQAELRVFRAPPDPTEENEDGPYYTFADLMDDTKYDEKDTPAASSVSSNRWVRTKVHLKDEDGEKLIPFTYEWLTTG